MVVDAIVTQKERLGSSLAAIKNHLSSKYKIDVNQKAGALNRVVKEVFLCLAPQQAGRARAASSSLQKRRTAWLSP